MRERQLAHTGHQEVTLVDHLGEDAAAFLEQQVTGKMVEAPQSAVRAHAGHEHARGRLAAPPQQLLQGRPVRLLRRLRSLRLGICHHQGVDRLAPELVDILVALRDQRLHLLAPRDPWQTEATKLQRAALKLVVQEGTELPFGLLERTV
jgi:hypothetical protein